MIPHSKPLLGKDEAEAASRVVQSGNLAQGTECAALEEELAEYLSSSHVIVVSSGSAALHLALLALDISPGNPVAIPSYVCSALLNAVGHTGAHPMMVDLPGEGFNIAPPTGVDASIVPHMFGRAAGIDTADSPIVEDCAMAIGGETGERKLGTLGSLGIFSFYATKVLCAGEGGAVCTDDSNLAERVRDLRDYDGRADATPRFNYKMTDIQAAIARVQLRSLDRFIEIRHTIASRYTAALQDTAAVLPTFLEGDVPFRYVIRHPDQDADTLIASYESNDVCARKPVYRPLHQYCGLEDAEYPNTMAAQRRAVSLPLYPALTEAEIGQIIGASRKIL